MPLTSDTYRRIVAAKMYMDEHYHDAIDLEQVSRQAFFSQFHFHRLFTRIYRKTPHQYITATRMHAAKAMLQEEGVSVTEVCANVGFESLGSFSLLFKKQHGCTPLGFRAFQKKKKQQVLAQPRSFIPHCFIEQYGLDK